ncbi:MAG TPA: sulfotransferase [Gammaproteobacteria bacterium]|nr:sulfotransferase [Gammaproteobacteria bacterium]
MTLKVIGAGFGRTGTLSLKEALDKLGYGPCHHMKEVMLNSEQAEYFYLASMGEKVDWDEVFKDYNSAVDWPAAAYYKELSEKYPDAKVILGMRDAGSWYDSASTTIYQMSQNFPKWIRLIFPRTKKLFKMIDKTIFGEVFSYRFEERESAMQVFNDHVEEVKRSIPEERLLMHSAKDGWEPLCAFLDVPVPEEPYPWVNDSKIFARRLMFIKFLKWLPVIILISALGFFL